MHRLGFAPSDCNQVLNRVLAQPEISVKGIYSHLADADNFESDAFTQTQIHQFEEVVTYFRTHLSDDFIAHLLNSEGALRFPNQAFDMVRLGIALYGYTENTELKEHLQESVSWFSAVSQVKKIQNVDLISICQLLVQRRKIINQLLKQ
jgi:alanine racemase